MSDTVKIAISLPQSIFDSVERERQMSKKSRSEFFRQAVSAFLRGLEERRQEERYVEGYRKHPESDGDTHTLEAVSNSALAREPW